MDASPGKGRNAGAPAFDRHIRQEVNARSPEQESLYGSQPGSFDGTYRGWKRLIYAPDRPLLLKAEPFDLNEATREVPALSERFAGYS